MFILRLQNYKFCTKKICYLAKWTLKSLQNSLQTANGASEMFDKQKILLLNRKT